MNACKDQRRGGAMTQQSLHGHPVNCPGRSQLRHGFFGWKGIAGEKSLLAHQRLVNPGASEGELRKMDVGVNKAGKQHLNSFSQLAFVAEYISPFFAPFMFFAFAGEVASKFEVDTEQIKQTNGIFQISKYQPWFFGNHRFNEDPTASGFQTAAYKRLRPVAKLGQRLSISR